MNREQVLTVVVLDKRIKKKDGTSPVKLRLTFLRKQKYYIVKRGLSFSENEFKKVRASRPRGEYKEMSLYLNAVENHANEIISSLDTFTFEKFEQSFFEKKQKVSDVISYFDAYISKLREKGKYNTADGYLYSKKTLIRFYGKDKIPFSFVNIDFLKSYEVWMVRTNRSYTTIGMYLRYLRAIFNQAIADGIIKQEDYPFGLNKYQIPKSKNTKRALTISEIEQIYIYEAEAGSTEEWARDMWIFSYLCNGMNITDVLRLKYKNIEGGKIKFYRKKTSTTTKERKQITVVITDDVNDIIERWGNKPQMLNSYIFPELSEGMNEEEKLRRIKQARKTINKYMKRIADKLEIDKEVTTYYARHSFGTVLKRMGVSSEFIKESFGHTSLQTTDNYLDSFEDETLERNAELLTAFKKNKDN